MSRIRWGNVGRLAALVTAAALIAFAPRGGGGTEGEQIPLDALPGEPAAPVEVRAPPEEPRVRVHRRPRRQSRKRRKPRRRAKQIAGEREQVHVAATRHSAWAPPRTVPPLRPRRRVPEAAREFSFDR